MRKLLVLSALTLLTSACVRPTGNTTPISYPPAETRYTGVAFDISASSKLGSVENRVDTLTPDAPKLLKPGVRVAFYPPDSCRETTAAPEGAQQLELVGMTCGVLMSSLETTAAKSGYEVVSWQLLKDKGALEAAKSFTIDVLLEVDQYSVNDRSSGKIASTILQFFEQNDASGRTPIPVTRDTALSCKAFIDGLLADAASSVSTEENSATLAVKAVDVNSGRALWYYQKTLQLVEGNTEAGAAASMYFAMPGTRPAPPPPPPVDREYNWMQKLGGGLMALGGIGTPIGAGFTAVQRYPEANAGVGILTTSVILLGGGATLVILGNKRAKKVDAPEPVEVPDATYPEAESVLCRTSPVVPPWEAKQAPSPEPQDPGKQYSYSFSEEQGGSEDTERRRREKLSRMAAEDLVAELGKLAASG